MNKHKHMISVKSFFFFGGRRLSSGSHANVQHPVNCDTICSVNTLYRNKIANLLKYKSKAIPLRASTAPESSSRLRLPYFKKVVRFSALRTRRLYPPRKYFWYSFLLEDESTPGPDCGRKDYVNGKFQ